MGRTATKTRGTPSGVMRITEWIEARPRVQGGRPVLKGTRITIDHLGLFLRGRLDLRAVAAEMGVPLEALEEARRVWMSGEYPREFWSEDQSQGGDDA